jgi:phosphoenolpyruvate-protein phosphotransferase
MALLTITGIGAAAGIGEGPAYLYRGPKTHRVEHTSAQALVPAAEPAAEIERLRRALASAAEQLAQLGAHVGAEIGPSEAAVFEAQALFLQDPGLVEPIEAAIRDAGEPAHHALERVFEAAACDLEVLGDPYLSARAADLRDVERRVLEILGATDHEDLSRVGGGAVLLAPDLLPSDTVGLRREHVHGIVLAGGTPTAHAAILARSLELPLVVGAGPGVWDVQPGQTVIVDGAAGTVLVDPDAAERAQYRRLSGRLERERRALHADAQLAPVTRDGRRVELFANASLPAEASLALTNGADGIGLLRTEFLLAALQGRRDSAPDEDALAAAYAEILALMGERPVVVRAMDAGGDKPLPFLDFGEEANPFLGWRGIRVLLDRPELFASQTRALLRATAAHGAEVRLMFPMASSLDEFVRARRLVEAVCREEGIAPARPLRIGVMIEVPGAALVADALARAADFFSLGTNDLVQYTLACDRSNARVGGLCRLEHPAVLRLIDLVVRAARGAGRPVGVCGEAAGEAAALPLLVGLGVDELSVSPNRLPEVRRQLRRLEYQKAQRLAADALSRATTEEVLALLATDGTNV